MANRFWVGGTGNWSDNTNHWSASSGGAPGASVPTSADNVYFDANSFSGAGQVVTVDVSAYCLDMDWTGVTNTPILAGTLGLYYSGNVTFSAAMSATLSGDFYKATVNTQTIDANGLNLPCTMTIAYPGTTRLLSDLQVAIINHSAGNFDTNGKTFTTVQYNGNYAGAHTLTLGSSILNIGTSGFLAGTGLTLTANTSTINVTGIGAFAGGNIATYNNINLNGTAHIVSGAFTCVTLTRNGTATKTDSVTFTSGTTVTCTTFAMIGNSATNRLLVQSTTLGSPATITATNWTGTVNVDIMDITATNAVDLSAITGLSGDCGGNTNITFTVAAAQTWDGTTGSWSSAAKWTSRVPLPQDDVSAGGAGNTITVDMPRIGKSITFTGTPIVSLSVGVNNYGSMTLSSGMALNCNFLGVSIFNRGIATLSSAGKVFEYLYLGGPGGTLTLSDPIVGGDGLFLSYGTINTANFSVTSTWIQLSATVTLNLGSSVVTLNRTATGYILRVYPGAVLNAGTSLIVFSNAGGNPKTFLSDGMTFNNVTIQGAGNYALTITGNNTFNTLEIDASLASKTVVFTDLTTQTVTHLKRTAGTNVITLQGTAAAGWNLIKVGSGKVGLDSMNISNSAVSPLGKWYAGLNSVNGGGNTNWIWASVPRFEGQKRYIESVR